jgi:hypothetical protein
MCMHVCVFGAILQRRDVCMYACMYVSVVPCFDVIRMYVRMYVCMHGAMVEWHGGAFVDVKVAYEKTWMPHMLLTESSTCQWIKPICPVLFDNSLLYFSCSLIIDTFNLVWLHDQSLPLSCSSNGFLNVPVCVYTRLCRRAHEATHNHVHASHIKHMCINLSISIEFIFMRDYGPTTAAWPTHKNDHFDSAGPTTAAWPTHKNDHIDISVGWTLISYLC